MKFSKHKDGSIFRVVQEVLQAQDVPQENDVKVAYNEKSFLSIVIYLNDVAGGETVTLL